MKILIVDDCAVNRVLLREIILSHHVSYQVFEVADLEGALDELAEIRPDVLITDLCLQGDKVDRPSGKLLIEEVLGNPRHAGVRVLITSGLSMEEIRQYFPDGQAVSILEKPYSLEEVKKFLVA